MHRQVHRGVCNNNINSIRGYIYPFLHAEGIKTNFSANFTTNQLPPTPQLKSCDALGIMFVSVLFVCYYSERESICQINQSRPLFPTNLYFKIPVRKKYFTIIRSKNIFNITDMNLTFFHCRVGKDRNKLLFRRSAFLGSFTWECKIPKQKTELDL